MNNYTVYMHVNKSNNKKYIGITRQKPEKRWGKNGCGYKRSPYFYNAIEKYGWDNFEHIIVVRGLSEDEAKWLEVQMIEAHNTTNRANGYNMTLGGEGRNGWVYSEEERQKQSEAMKGKHAGKNNPMYGRSGELSPNYGKHHSEETKRKISAARKGSGAAKGSKNPSARKVLCVELNMVFDTMKEAGLYAGCSPSNISSCCSGRLKTSGGYHWEYVS